MPDSSMRAKLREFKDTGKIGSHQPKNLKEAVRIAATATPGPAPTPTRDVGFGSGQIPPRWHPDSPEYERQQEEFLQKVYGRNPKTGSHYTDRPARR